MGDAVRRVLADFRGQPPAAIVLLSDGVTTAGVPLVAAAQDARRAAVPIMAVGLGSDERPRDIEVADMLVDDAAFVGDALSFQVQLKASGLGAQAANVVLRRRPNAAEANDGVGESVATQAIILPPNGQSLTLQLVDRPSVAADYQYTVEVVPRDDELNRDNNRQARSVSVRDAKIRVLLAAGYPNYEFRFLKTLLERDSTIELATYLQDADPGYAEQDRTALPSFPAGRDELFPYDVLILGDLDPDLLPSSVWPEMREFVSQRGGGLALLAGPRHFPEQYRDNANVAALVPVDLGAFESISETPSPVANRTGFQVRPTQLGLACPPLQLGDAADDTPRAWQQLAPLYWHAPPVRLKPAAQVLAEVSAESAIGNPRSEIPAICFQYVGAGRVLLHAIDSTWRWRRGAGETYFARYWVQMIRYLARSKLSSGRGGQLTTDRRRYERGEAVQVRARILDPQFASSSETAIVAVDSPGRARQQVELRRNPAAAGVFSGSLAELPPGDYQLLLTAPQVTSTPPEARFSVHAPPGELARPEMDRTALTEAAETTHGAFCTAADFDQLLAKLPAGQRVPVENRPPIELWNRWWLLAAFFACVISEWILRKRAGML